MPVLGFWGLHFTEYDLFWRVRLWHWKLYELLNLPVKNLRNYSFTPYRLHFLVNEVNVCRLALSMPVLEPFTPDRIAQLSDISTAALLCATAQVFWNWSSFFPFLLSLVLVLSWFYVILDFNNLISVDLQNKHLNFLQVKFSTIRVYYYQIITEVLLIFLSLSLSSLFCVQHNTIKITKPVPIKLAKFPITSSFHCTQSYDFFSIRPPYTQRTMKTSSKRQR